MEAVIANWATGERLREIPRSEDRRAGFAEIYRRHGRPLYGTALRMLRRPEDAEDAVQDAFLAYHRKRPELPELEIGRWLNRVVINNCLDRLRRGKRWRNEELEETTVTTPPPPEELGLDLQTAIARLPEKARAVFLLHDVEGLKHRELAEMLGLTEGTSKSQLFRARQMLRSRINRGNR